MEEPGDANVGVDVLGKRWEVLEKVGVFLQDRPPLVGTHEAAHRADAGGEEFRVGATESPLQRANRGDAPPHLRERAFTHEAEPDHAFGDTRMPRYHTEQPFSLVKPLNDP